MIKKLSIFLLFVLTVYSVYYDLTVGTLPTTSASTDGQLQSEVAVDVKKAYKQVTVEAGYTVLSIVEQLHYPEKVEVSIQTIIKDFEELNPNVSAHQIHIGTSYFFPMYHE
ncbi:MAG: hypothetical protein LRY71_19205 [Bacillaceae bacterium]|nr:hypothetical protein [Bacillaceae bacterium]